MYSSRSGMVYGFHGLDREAGLKILNREERFESSDNDYDWLGPGVYFWEDNLERAWEYAENPDTKATIKTPFVLGAVIELGKCLDLLDQAWIDFLKKAYQELEKDMENAGKTLPQNNPSGSRRLDNAVVKHACRWAKEQGEPFDSVRSVFIEGGPLYENSGFRMKNHIQLAIINTDCIKGVFLPEEGVA